MEWPRAYTTACRHADHDICVLPPAVMDLRQVVDNLVKAYCYKISKLHFHHGLKSFQRHTEAGAYDGTFTKRCITHPLFSKCLYKTFRDLECTTIFRNILSHQHKVLMLLHALVQTFF